MKKEFNEAVGVPEGIVDAGEKLYNDMKLNLIPQINLGQLEYKMNFQPKEPYKVGDMEINDVELSVTLHPVSDEYEISNMQVFNKLKLQDTGKSVVFMSVSPYGNLKLHIDKPVPEDWTVQGVKDSFDRMRVKTVSSLSHELMHDYEKFKKKSNRPSHLADYHAKVQLFNFPVSAISNLFYKLYYMDEVENTVRPTELYSKLKLDGIRKGQFLDYFKKEYKLILDAMKFNVDELKSELLNNVDEVDELLRGVEDLKLLVDDMTDEEKVNTLLRIAYVNFSNTSGSTLKDMLTTNPFELIFGFEGSKGPYFNKHIRRLAKHSDDPIGFYRDAEKYLKNTGQKVIRRMSKVYDLLPE
jgi:hypothetical protein